MFIQPKNTPNIKVIGIGGQGTQTVEEMAKSDQFPSVAFMTLGIESGDTAPYINPHTTNDQILHITIPNDPRLDDTLEQSYQKWETIASSHTDEIRTHLERVDILFITCNEGRGFSTGVAPVIARIGQESGALVIAIVTEPFTLEGKYKKKIAKVGIEKLQQSADLVIPVSKQKLFDYHIKGTPIREEFDKIKAPLYKGVSIISDIIHLAQLINIDLSDLRLIMKNSTSGFIGEGVGTGDMTTRTKQAIDQALSFPLTDNSLKDARNILFNITGGKELTMHEVVTIADTITKTIDTRAKIKFGVTIDEKMEDSVKVTVIATDMNKAPFQSLDKPHTHNPHDKRSMSDLEIPTFLRKHTAQLANNRENATAL